LKLEKHIETDNNSIIQSKILPLYFFNSKCFSFAFLLAPSLHIKRERERD